MKAEIFSNSFVKTAPPSPKGSEERKFQKVSSKRILRDQVPTEERKISNSFGQKQDFRTDGSVRKENTKSFCKRGSIPAAFSLIGRGVDISPM